MKFLHTMLRVKDIDKSLNFYQNIIGLKLSRTKDLSHRGAMLYFLTDDAECCEIELTHNFDQPEEGYEHGTYFGHLAFEIHNMDEFTQRLKKNGMDYDRAPFLVTDKGPNIAFVKDPDGYAIEIIEK